MTLRIFWLALGVWVSAPPALAQPGDARPYRALFGGAETKGGPGRSVGVSLSLAEGFTKNTFDDRRQRAQSLEDILRGLYSEAGGQLTFASNGRSTLFAANAGSIVRYYHDLAELSGVSHFAAIGVIRQLGRRTQLFANQSVTYSPASLYGLFVASGERAPGDFIIPTTDYAQEAAATLSYETDLTLSQQLGRRDTLTLLARYFGTDFTGSSAELPGLTSYELGTSYRHGFARDAGFRLGYTYRHTEYSTTYSPLEHVVDVGLDFNRPLSRSRRTKLALLTGSTVVRGPVVQHVGPFSNTLLDGDEVGQFRFLADATLSHQIGRTWTARARYRRGVGFIQGIPAPAFTDAVTLNLGGFLNRRTDLGASGAYTTGAWATVSEARVSTYTGSVRLRVGLRRNWAAYVSYVIYSYDLAGDFRGVYGSSNTYTRSTVSTGLTLWFPLRGR